MGGPGFFLGLGIDGYREHLDRVHGPKKATSPTKESANRSTLETLTEVQLRLVTEAGQASKHHGLGSQFRAAWSIIFPGESIPAPFKVTVDQLIDSLHECPPELRALTRQRASAARSTDTPEELVREVVDAWVHLLKENGGCFTELTSSTSPAGQQLVLRGAPSGSLSDWPCSLYPSPSSNGYGETRPRGPSEDISGHFDNWTWHRAENDMVDEGRSPST